jgi:hypothetical protein
MIGNVSTKYKRIFVIFESFVQNLDFLKFLVYLNIIIFIFIFKFINQIKDEIFAGLFQKQSGKRLMLQTGTTDNHML